MPPNDIETGVSNGSKPYKFKEAGMPAPESSSRGAPSILSAQPDAEDTSREPELKDVWNKWIGKPAKNQTPYAQPPQKGERHELETFQNLVGIYFLRPGGGLLYPDDQGSKPASPLHDIFLPTKAAAKRWRNRGLYDRTLSQDLKNRVLYGMSNYIITFLYLLQILIAAALTGLSAYQQTSSIALTTLGAINTVLAGVLAWLNGQGMPVRFRRARDQYREVVRAIEDTERTFAEIDYVDWPPGTRPNPYAERDRLEQMYDEARQDQERNYPDIQEGPNKSQMEGEARQLRETISEEKSKKGAFSKLLEKTKEDHKQQLQTLEKAFTDKIKKTLAEQEGRIRTEVEFKHLQKVAEEQARNCTCSKHAGASVIPPARDDAREGPQAGPQVGPEEFPREMPPTSPLRSRSPVRSPFRSPANAPNEPPVRSPARSPRRMPSNAPVMSPPRSPMRPISASPTRSRTRSPERRRASSPVRPPSSSPSRSPSSSRGRPSEDVPSEPGAQPRTRGPSGLFTNI